MKIYLTLVFLLFPLTASLLPSHPVLAQNGDELLPVVPPMPGQVVRFDHLTDEDGLLSDETNNIYQDRNGYIWIGNWNGIQRYDGYEFKNFHHDPNDPTTISHDFWAQFFEDASGNLWITTVDGLNLYDPTTETFTRFYPDADNPDRANFNIFAISESSLGGYWFGTREGLVYFDPATERFLTYRHDPENPTSLSDDFVTAVLEDSSGNLWVGTFADGLNRLVTPLSEIQKSIETGETSPLQFERVSLDEDEETNRVNHIMEDSAGTRWFGTRNGLAKLTSNQSPFVIYRLDTADPYSLSDNQIGTILEDRQGYLWIGTFSGGLNQLDPESGKFRHYRNDGQPDGLRADSVADLHEDAQGLLWISTGVNGISILDRGPLAFGYFRQEADDPGSLSHSKVNAVWEGEDGDLWIGTEEGLNHLVANAVPRFEHFFHDPDDATSLSSDRISEVIKDSSGTVWVGTYDGGINRLKPGETQFERFMHDENDTTSLSNDKVYSLAEDNNGAIWIGTSSGLDRFIDGENPTFEHVYETDKRVVATFIDSLGNLWFGNGDGLKTVHRKDLNESSPPIGEFPFTDEENAHSNSVQAIAEDAQGFLWVGTFDGLQKFDPDTEEFVDIYYVERADPPEKISAGSHGVVFNDDDGILWVGGDTIYRLDPEFETFTEFSEDDGVMSGLVNNAYGGPSGRIFFGGFDGLNAFYPENITPHTYEPPTVLTDFLLYNEPIAIDPEGVLPKQVNAAEQILLDHDDDIFAFDFAALNFRNPQQNQYAYYLEGFDDDWIYTDANNRRATYTNIPPGEYTFHVKGSNDVGVWNEDAASVRITIAPPWWQRWWFRGAMLLLVIGLAYGVYRWRVRSLEEQKRRLELQVVDRTEELATFFDLAVIERDGMSLTALMTAVIPRIAAASRSQAITVHLFAGERSGKIADGPVDEGASIRLAGQYGLTPGQENWVQSASLEGAFARWVLADNEPLTSNDLAKFEAIPKTLRPSGFISYLGAQIRVRESTQGVLGCYRQAENSYSTEEIAFLVALADQLGIMMENHDLRQRIQKSAVTDERRRLARELHDSVTQSMYSLVLLAEGGQRLARTGNLDNPDEYLGELEDIALQSLREMRLLVYELRPMLLNEEGLIGALEHRLDAVERRAGVETSLDVKGEIDLSPEQGQAFFGIAQEALNNALKHSMATHLCITVIADANSTELTITDDGSGFDPARLTDTGGMGLETMRERAEQIGASYALDSILGKGTTVQVTLEGD